MVAELFCKGMIQVESLLLARYTYSTKYTYSTAAVVLVAVDLDDLRRHSASIQPIGT